MIVLPVTSAVVVPVVVVVVVLVAVQGGSCAGTSPGRKKIKAAKIMDAIMMVLAVTAFFNIVLPTSSA